MSPTTERPSFMSGVPILGQTESPKPKLFALDLAGRPVPVSLGPGLRLDIDVKTAEFILNAVPPAPNATVVGETAEWMADTDTYLIPLPIENAAPKQLSGFALYRDGRRQRMGVDFTLDPTNVFRVIPAANVFPPWDASDWVSVDYVATY